MQHMSAAPEGHVCNHRVKGKKKIDFFFLWVFFFSVHFQMFEVCFLGCWGGCLLGRLM